MLKALVKKVARISFLTVSRLESRFDKAFLVDDVPKSTVFHKWQQLSEEIAAASPRKRILEVGSREVTGPSTARQRFANCDYVGFDFYAGRNVDIVGDVHRLSSYFAEGEQFDVIYTIACMEHFAMPWLVAQEFARMLKVGGVLFVATHFSYGSHERPWNFFQFSDMGLRVLFSEGLGFECIDSGMSNPIVGRFSAFADPELRYQPIKGLFCGSEYLGTKVREVEGFAWSQVAIDQVVSGTVYPAPRANRLGRASVD